MQHEFLAMVREAREGGTAVFLSSHVLSEVQRVADRVAVLRAGRIVAVGTVSELRGHVRQHVEIWFAGPVPITELVDLPGITDPTVDGQRFAAILSGPVGPLITVLGRHEVATIRIEDPDLEDAFLDLYGRPS
jgi:ABC-2 type transport system ATP-binding protein